MRAQSAIVHATVRRPNTCKQRHHRQFLPRKFSVICPLDSFPAKVGSLLSVLPSNTRVGRDVREHCQVSPIPTHSKGQDNGNDQKSLTPEVEGKLPLHLDLHCHVCMHEFFKALLTTLSHTPNPILSPVVSSLPFLSPDVCGERAGAGSSWRLSPGDHSWDTTFVEVKR